MEQEEEISEPFSSQLVNLLKFNRDNLEKLDICFEGNGTELYAYDLFSKVDLKNFNKISDFTMEFSSNFSI